MSDRETRRKIIDAMVNVVRQKLGREAAPQISILRELLNATEALFEKGVGAPRKGRPELRRYNPSDELAVLADAKTRLLVSLAETGTDLHLTSEAASIGAIVESALNVARWDNARTGQVEHATNHETLLFQPMGEIESFTPIKISDTMWMKWRSTSPLATAGRLEISDVPFPPPETGDFMTPPGLVRTVLLPSQGEFLLSWQELRLTDSIAGRLKKPSSKGKTKPDYYLRVVPLMATIPTMPAGRPSNTVEVYRIIPPPPQIKVIPPEPESRGASPSLSKPLYFRVDFECLGCSETNEVVDEPYLAATGISSKIGCWPVWWPKPLFTGVKGTTGNWCPIGITPVGPNDQAVVVTPGETIGFNVALFEQDNSDDEQARAIWGRLGQLTAEWVAAKLSDDEGTQKLAGEFGQQVGLVVALLYEAADPDDFIGQHTVLWTYDQLVSSFWKSWDSHLKAVHEGLQGFARPEMHPEYQQYFEVGNHLDFAGDGAKYRLYYSAKLVNPYYIGPYNHNWNS